MPFFNIEDTNELAVLDPRIGKIISRQDLAPCISPTGLAIDDRQRLYSVCRNKWMVISDNGKVFSQVSIGAGSDGVVWLDGLAFSDNGADGTLTVVGEQSPGQFVALTTAPTAQGARTIAGDPLMHRLYLPAADFKPSDNNQPTARITR